MYDTMYENPVNNTNNTITIQELILLIIKMQILF